MITENILEIRDVQKHFKGFQLNVPKLDIPKGFAIALIGENGAGKSTLLNILAKIRLDFKGELKYFDGETNEYTIQEKIGYTGPDAYFLPHWSVKKISKICSLLFDNFHPDRYEEFCTKMGVAIDSKKVSALSDGMKMKVMLASVFARDTQFLLLDEPASPLDPLMRDGLCTLIREYLEEGNGEKSVLFSTHNISDMENVTDYAVIMDKGRIKEQGFVDELKEKYVYVKGELQPESNAANVLIGYTQNTYGYEGLCLADDLDKLAGLDIAIERPSLSQISISIMKQCSSLSI